MDAEAGLSFRSGQIPYCHDFIGSAFLKCACSCTTNQCGKASKIQPLVSTQTHEQIMEGKVNMCSLI